MQTLPSLKGSPFMESPTNVKLPAGMDSEILNDKDRRKGDRCMYTIQELPPEDDEHGSPRSEIVLESQRTP
jgi:hypothetical protein